MALQTFVTDKMPNVNSGVSKPCGRRGANEEISQPQRGWLLGIPGSLRDKGFF
jgi:hypothetical protein